MQNFPPLAPYQFFWNWNKCFNSKKPAALQAERQAVTWLLFQATGWASVDFEHQGVFHSLISFLSSAPHNWKLSFKFALELSTPGSSLWKRNKNGCRKHTFAVHAANVNGKKKKKQQLPFINQMCQKGPRKIYSYRYIFGDSQSKQMKSEKQMINNNNKTPVH